MQNHIQNKHWWWWWFYDHHALKKCTNVCLHMRKHCGRRHRPFAITANPTVIFGIVFLSSYAADLRTNHFYYLVAKPNVHTKPTDERPPNHLFFFLFLLYSYVNNNQNYAGISFEPTQIHVGCFAKCTTAAKAYVVHIYRCIAGAIVNGSVRIVCTLERNETEFHAGKQYTNKIIMPHLISS